VEENFLKAKTMVRGYVCGPIAIRWALAT